VGALSSVRAELQMSIVEPILHPDRFKMVGLQAPAGVLLYGPPGCGKTLVARAVSNESKANFISIKGPELLNKYVGESEKAVRQLFKRAKASAPCVIFFDELDSLVPKRGSEGNNSSERVVNQLLTEMDGLEDRRGVFVIAATNRPDIIDPAMLRPGRLDKLLYVPLPTKEDRHQILKTVTAKLPIASDVDLKTIGHSEHCEGFSGADLSALVREAQMSALKQAMESGQQEGI
jgi:ribosome biogenesis ATPase